MPLPCRDDSLLLGDVVLLANNAVSLDLWVIARKATRGSANPLASFDYFLAHLPAEVNHASMLVLAWLLAGTHRLRHPPQAPPRKCGARAAATLTIATGHTRAARASPLSSMPTSPHPATTAHHHA